MKTCSHKTVSPYFLSRGHTSTGAEQDSQLRVKTEVDITVSAVQMHARTRRKLHCFALIWCFRCLKQWEESFMSLIIAYNTQYYWLPVPSLYLRPWSGLPRSSSKHICILAFNRASVLVGGEAPSKQMYNVWWCYMLWRKIKPVKGKNSFGGGILIVILYWEVAQSLASITWHLSRWRTIPSLHWRWSEVDQDGFVLHLTFFFLVVTLTA